MQPSEGMEHRTTLLLTEPVTHDVQRFIVERPEGFQWNPGQGVEIALDLDGWRDEGRPFTPTSLPDDRVLEFTIKGYPEHDGVTHRLHQLRPGATLHMSEPFGTLTDRGPGVFIAGGAGLTPFLAILRQHSRDGELADSRLIFANKARGDVICEQELLHHLGERCVLTLTREEAPGYRHGRPDRAMLEELVDDFAATRFYVCGPPPMVEELTETLTELGASPDSVVLEE